MKMPLTFILILLLSGCNQENISPAIKCFNTDECIDVIKEKIERNWHVPDEKDGLSASVSIELNERNVVISSKLVTTSGHSDFDESILKAIRASSPFSELTGLSPLEREVFDSIEFTFNPDESKERRKREIHQNNNTILL